MKRNETELKALVHPWDLLPDRCSLRPELVRVQTYSGDKFWTHPKHGGHARKARDVRTRRRS